MALAGIARFVEGPAHAGVLRWRLVLAGLLAALVLSGALFVRRAGASQGVSEHAALAAPTRRAKLLGALALLFAAFPLLNLAPWLHGPPLTMWGDTPSHARVAAEIARTLLPHGWIDGYVGGFPFGHHYPQLGWLLLAAEIRAGLPPAAAVHVLGFGCTLAAPLALYFALVRCDVRPAFACAGAAFLCWVSPYNAFVGGYETFFSAGLVSQALALPLCIWLVAATVKSRNRWEAPLAAWLSISSHPQVTVATLVVLGLSLLGLGRRDALSSGLRTAAMALLAGAALYGQGIATLDIPLGWPPELGWRQLGFAPSRLRWWLLDGDLLDRDRAPVLTALSAAAFLILLLNAQRAVNRALLVALGASLLLAVSGRVLLSLGTPGAVLLSFLQPLRVVSLIPPLAAVALAVALEQAAASLAAALCRVGRTAHARRTSLALLLLVMAVASFAVPARMRWSGEVASILRRGSESCSGDPSAPPGYDHDAIRDWLASLTGGKLWYEAHQPTNLGGCLSLDGIELASAVPIATATAVGAHVGVLAHAASHLEAERAGSAARAEALGIAYLLREAGDEAPLSGWAVRNQRGSVQLLSQAVENIGVGCIRQRWSGSAAQIRARLNQDLATAEGADALLDPHGFTAIDYGSGPVVESAWPDSGCSAMGATVGVISEEAGAIRATVQTLTAVDVVFRVTAFPTWRVLIDGEPTSQPTLVAPGFSSVRVEPGRHHLEAQVSLMPGYAWLVAGAALATAALARIRAPHLGAALKRLRLPRLRRQ